MQIINGCDAKFIFSAVLICKFAFILAGLIGAIFLLMCMQIFTMFLMIASVAYIILNISMNAVILRKMLSKNIDQLLRGE